jgi:hypothetical protein
MEEDILHFPEGVLVDDVIRVGLVGIVALREDRKPVIKFAPSNIFQHFIDVERRVYERLNSSAQYDGLLKYYGSLDQGLILEYTYNKSVTELTDVAGVHRTRLCRTLARYGKLLPSPANPPFIYHGGPRLHQLHRPELPVPPLGTIDRSASPYHLPQPSWVGPGPAPDRLPVHNSQTVVEKAVVGRGRRREKKRESTRC